MRAIGRRERFLAHAILVGFGERVTKTPIYSVIRRLPFFAALCDRSPPTLRTDGQTSCS